MKCGATKPSSLIVEIHHHARVDTANPVKMKHRKLIDFNAFTGSTLNHKNIPQNNLRNSNPALFGARRASLKVSATCFLKLYGRGIRRFNTDRSVIIRNQFDDNLTERARKLAKRRQPIFALARRENSGSTDATSFPLRPSRKPGSLARALRVVCIARLAH